MYDFKDQIKNTRIRSSAQSDQGFRCSLKRSFFIRTAESYRLEVETGRWTRPVSTPFDERKCHICDRLEDELHFLFKCPLCNELRTQYLSRYSVVRPSMYKLTELFKTEVKSVSKTCQYIYLKLSN